MAYHLILAVGGVAAFLAGWLAVQRLGRALRMTDHPGAAGNAAEPPACAACAAAPGCTLHPADPRQPDCHADVPRVAAAPAPSIEPTPRT